MLLAPGDTELRSQFCQKRQIGAASQHALRNYGIDESCADGMAHKIRVQPYAASKVLRCVVDAMLEQFDPGMGLHDGVQQLWVWYRRDRCGVDRGLWDRQIGLPGR